MAALNKCVKKGIDTDPVLAFLWSASEAAEALREQRERVAGLESRCARVTPSLDGAPGGLGDGPEALWAKLADEREREKELAQEAENCRELVEEVLGKLARPLDREAMRLRYLGAMTWPEVQRELISKGFRCGVSSMPRINNRNLPEVGRLAGVL